MSEKNKVTKRKETYRAAIKKFKGDRELYDVFSKLNRAIPQRKTRTPLTDEDLNKMSTAYNNAINTLTSKMEQAEADLGNLELDLEGKRLENAQKKMQGKLDYYNKLRKTLSKDFKTIAAVKKLGPEQRPNITQFYETARSKKLEFDLKKAKVYAGASSTRYRVQSGDFDGFFTISKPGQTLKKQTADILADVNRKYGSKSVFKTRIEADMLKLSNTLLRNSSSNLWGSALEHADDLIDQSMVKKNRHNLKLVMTKVIQKAYENNSIDENIAEAQKKIVKNLKDYEMVSLIEYMHGYTQVYNADDLNQTLGVNKKSKVEKRNAAASMVADLVGCKNILATSKTLQIKDPETGKIVSGVYMENAEGIDRNSAKREDIEKFNNLSPEKIQNSFGLKKDIANLQVVDWLIGNPDRHFCNFFYKFDAEGNPTGIVGIDNDLSFGTKDHYKMCSGMIIENMSVIPKETAERVMSMNKEEFKNMLFGYDLTLAEVNKAVGRLEELQDKIERDINYYKDMPKGYVESGRIKVVDDEELRQLSFYNDLAAGETKARNGVSYQNRNDKNLFATVGLSGMEADACNESIVTLKDQILKNSAAVTKNAVKIEAAIDAMEASERKTRNGHQPFRTMIEKMKSCKEGKQLLEAGLMEIDNGDVKVNENLVKQYKKVLEEARTSCNDYMATKDEKKIMKLSKTSNGYERYMLAKNSRDDLDRTIKQLDDMIEMKATLKDTLDQHDQLVERCDKEFDKINKEYAEKRKPIKEAAKKVLDERKAQMQMNKGARRIKK